MITPSDLANAISTSVRRCGLTIRDDMNEPDWTFWELRTLNRHRVVGFLTEVQRVSNVQELEAKIRGAISSNFHRAWWRGLAFGIVAEVEGTSIELSNFDGLIDIYENRKGVFQWLVLVANDSQTAVGVHTWMETYLSPVYRDILQALKTNGYQVTTAVKGKDGLLKFLTGAAEMEGVAFPEFTNTSVS